MEILSIRVLNFSLATSLSVLGGNISSKVRLSSIGMLKVSYPDSMNQGQEIGKQWRMRREMRTPRYTTHWDDLLEVE